MTLYGIIRELLQRGELTTRPSYHAQMGVGETLIYRDNPVRIFTEVNTLRGLVPPDKVVDFEYLTDVLLDSDYNMITHTLS
jgi:hypothetical protein